MKIPLKGIDVIPDFLVAKLDGVETREISQTIKNNPDKFPKGFTWALTYGLNEGLNRIYLVINIYCILI